MRVNSHILGCETCCRIKASADFRVNSPALINPKNPMQHAAHSIMISGSVALEAHLAFMDLSRDGVMGSRRRVGSLGARLIPRKTYWRRGKAPGVNRSPWPAII